MRIGEICVINNYKNVGTLNIITAVFFGDENTVMPLMMKKAWHHSLAQAFPWKKESKS